MENCMQGHPPKALIVATVGRFLNFEKNDITLLQALGYEVHCAANLSGEMDHIPEIDVMKHHIDFKRSPFTTSNFKAFIQMKNLLKSEKYDLIHCHTPVGGVITRLAAKPYRNKNTTIIYTAHGFHFYHGAPLKNWLLYYPIEKICSYMTDVLITINKEDYRRAMHEFHAKKSIYVPGIGIDPQKFNSIRIDPEKKRQELGLGYDEIMLLSTGELSGRKNHELVIKALDMIQTDKAKIHYFICGKGDLYDYLLSLAKRCGINLHLLGFRTDIAQLCQAADLFVFPSKQEGLPVALMEAIACKTPVVCSRIRGNTDLVNRYTFDWEEPAELKNILEKVFSYAETEKTDIHTSFRKFFRKSILENLTTLRKFNLDNVQKTMNHIYSEETKKKNKSRKGL